MKFKRRNQWNKIPAFTFYQLSSLLERLYLFSINSHQYIFSHNSYTVCRGVYYNCLYHDGFSQFIFTDLVTQGQTEGYFIVLTTYLNLRVKNVSIKRTCSRYFVFFFFACYEI